MASTSLITRYKAWLARYSASMNACCHCDCCDNLIITWATYNAYIRYENYLSAEDWDKIAKRLYCLTGLQP